MKLGFLNTRVYKRFSTFRLLEFTLLQMLQHNVQLGAAVRFSLLSSHWFVFGSYRNFSIINLSQTAAHYRYFLEVIRYVTNRARHMLFVDERRFTTFVVADVAKSVGEAYVVGRWIGGSLTNFKKLWFMYHRLLGTVSDNSLGSFKNNLKNSLSGLAFLHSLPSLIFVNSVKLSHWVTGEAYALLIPSVGITDTDALPHSVLYPVPGNDDAFGSIFFFNQLAAKAVLISKISRLLKKYNEFVVSFKRWSAYSKHKRVNAKRGQNKGNRRGARFQSGVRALKR